MAKKMKKLMSLILALSMVMSFMSVVASATGEPETIDNGDGTYTIRIVDTDSQPDENGNTKTVTITKDTIDGTTDAGVLVDYEKTYTETTVTDPDNNQIDYQWVNEGSEFKSWTEEDSGDAAGQKPLNVKLEPGTPTTGSATSFNVTGDDNKSDNKWDYTETTTVERTISAVTSSSSVVLNETSSSLIAVGPDKYEGKQDLDYDIYALKDPDAFHVQEVEGVDHAASDYQYVGYSEARRYGATGAKVIYARENGQIVLDGAGNPIIDHFETFWGSTIKTSDGEVITDYETLVENYNPSIWAWAVQFLLQNGTAEDYDSVFAYCCDMDIDPVDNAWYSVSNLEDSDYFASEESEEHIRGIVENGYWGSVSGTGSVAQIKASMLQAIANGSIEDVVVEEATEGTDAVYLSDVIDDLTEGEAMKATQAAIWSYANGSLSVQNPRDGFIVIDPTIGETGAGAARVRALYDWLMKQTVQDREIVVNEKNFLESSSLTIGDKVGTKTITDENGEEKEVAVYEAAVNFTLAFEPDAEDDFLVYISYTDANGDPVVITKRLSGTAAENEEFETIQPDNGVYTISGLLLNENEEFSFDLSMEGTQHLDRGVYLYTAVGGRTSSQTMVGLAEGTRYVDISNTMSVSFDVDETNSVRSAHYWRDMGGSVVVEVTLKKVGESGNALSGAEFTLSCAGEVIGTYAVDENGELTISDLTPDTVYELKETKAPAGYVLPADPISFKVNEENEVILIEGENTVIEETVTTVITGEKDEEIVVGEELPVISLELNPGTNPNAEVTGKVNTETGYILIKRTASAVVSDVDTVVNSSATGETTAVAPVYDVVDGVKEDKGGMFDYQFNSGLTSTYSNPATWTDMPADADVRYVGTGEHSKYYIYCAYVEYEKNADGSVKVDENGNYVIKQLRRYDTASSPSLTIDGEVTTELITGLGFDSAYDNPGGSRPFMFAMKDREGQAYYGYCCDLDTPTSDGYYYSIANLEDSDYYANEESEAHIRSIVMNGYWGTTGIPAADGSYAFGSLELLKQKLIAYLDANPALNTELTAPILDPNNKYQPMVDENGDTICATKTMKEMVEGLTSGEALLATQAAIWSYANGSYNVHNGNDGSIVLDPDGYKWNHDAMGNSKWAGGYTNGEAMDDFASAAVDFLYTWLVNLDTDEESTVVINDKNFVENLTLDIGNKVEDTDGNDVYSVDLSFNLGFTPGEKDNLLVEVTYGDSTIAKRLAGENGEGEDYAYITVKDGRYVIEGLAVPENEITNLTLRLIGKQYLEHGAYIYEAHGGRKNSQNFVGVAEGEKVVDVSKTISFSYEADETKHVVEAHEEPVKVLKVTNVRSASNPTNPVVPSGPAVTSVTVSKVWNDNNDAAEVRPESVTVQLLANGVPYNAATLSAANDWNHTWNNLTFGVNYSVAEVNVPEGYTSVVSGSGTSFTITNTYEVEINDDDPPLADGDAAGGTGAAGGSGAMEEEIFDEDLPLADAPATGDMTALWIAASAVSAAGLLFLGKKSKEEE